MKQTVIALATVVLASLSGPVAAGDINAGKAKAASCAACHGANGISINPMWPNIAGQQDQYMIKQLKAFKDGTRSDPLMSSQAQALSDADMANLAAYYSSLK